MYRYLFTFFLVILGLSGIRAQQNCGTVTDYDGNVYSTVQLGTQCWMAQNLKVTHYADGKPLTLGTATQGSERLYFYPNNSKDNVAQYGLLYSWYTALNGATPTENVPSGLQGVCPNGWHLPSNFEWMGLEDFLGYKDEYRCGTDVNNVAKALASKEGWMMDLMSNAPECSISDNMQANNTSGMNVLPSGGVWQQSYDGFGRNTGYWTASDGSDITSPIHYFAATNATVEINCTPKEAAYAVRCLKN